jgi:hypothetical protein
MCARRLILAVTVLALAGCASLPSKDKVARLYQREHSDRHVTHVEKKQIPQKSGLDEVWFIIIYTIPPATTSDTDFWKYHAVAQGMVRYSP